MAITVTFPGSGAQDCPNPFVASGTVTDGYSITGVKIVGNGVNMPGNVSVGIGTWTATFIGNVPCGVPLTLIVNGTDQNGNPITPITVDFSCNC